MTTYKPYTILRRCPRCPRPLFPPSRRHFSSQSTHVAQVQCAPLPTRRLICLSGRAVPQFLHGLTTSQISLHSAERSSRYSAFLNATGRVLYDVFIYAIDNPKEYQKEFLGGMATDPACLIEVDANEVDNLAQHLKRFRLRSKIGARILDGKELGVWSAWSTSDKSLRSVAKDSLTWCYDHRAPHLGCRLLQWRNKPPILGEEVSEEQYHVRRIMSGVAEGPLEITKGSALPQQGNIDYMGGIDFRKGCYVGQELTIRTHHTGVVRKRILPVQIYDSGREAKPPDSLSYDLNSTLVLPPRGADISRVDEKGRSAGTWLGGVGNIGLALCRLEVMTDTVLTTEGNSWSPDDEFKVAWKPEEGKKARKVKIKAFVPDWHKERAEEQKIRRGGKR